MKLGFTAINCGNLATVEVGAYARLAEELGYESFWTAEHIVIPDQAAPAPGSAPGAAGNTSGARPGNFPILDTIATLGYLAALTSTIRLGTGVINLPQHEPLLLAKQLASVDVLSNGRIIAGFGLGSVISENIPLGVPVKERGARATEWIEVMLAMWTMEHPRYSGRFVTVDGFNSYPRPVQKPAIPIVIGGRAEAAIRRTVRYASGWFGFNRNLEYTRETIDLIAAAEKQHGRPDHLGPVEITISPAEDLTRDVIAAYEDLGVVRLLLRLPQDKTSSEVKDFIHRYAPGNFGL